MISVVLIGWLLVVGIQLIVIVFVFGRLAFTTQNSPAIAANKLPAVTLIVCARNELDNLQELIPLLANQHYPAFEVLVMDDRSTDGSNHFWKQWPGSSPMFAPSGSIKNTTT